MRLRGVAHDRRGPRHLIADTVQHPPIYARHRRWYPIQPRRMDGDAPRKIGIQLHVPFPTMASGASGRHAAPRGTPSALCEAAMRIVAGAWRGRALTAPPGQATRPTADRVRQALFDMLLHAPWAGRHSIEG